MADNPPFKADPFLEACLSGSSSEIIALKECITRLNAQDDEVRSVLLLGESGVGKTYLAKVIAMHRCWLKESFLKTEKERPTAEEIADQKHWYVRTQGSGILKASGEPYQEVPLPLLEGNIARSWLFGHKKGAFTGADKDQKGFLGEEHVTDVLLDEIGYASLDMQRSLLQVIQSGEFYKLGSTKQETTEARLIFATNQNLEDLVHKGEFQEDLWWRLTDHVLYIPPLRERRNEIGTIANGILASLNQAHIRGDTSGYLYLKKADLEWSDSHEWPGNIRELEKTIRRWFFYRGSRSLQEVWTQIAPFVPQGKPHSNKPIKVDALKLRSFLRDQLQSAVSTNQSLGTLSTIVKEHADSARSEVAKALVASVDDLKLSNEQLEQLFPKMAPTTIRPWLSKNRR